MIRRTIRRAGPHRAWKLRAAAFALGAASLAAPVSGLAQSGVVRAGVPVSQRQAEQELATALRELGRNPRSIPALLTAGKASLVLDDAQAAQGFFARAQAAAPQDGRVKAGLASVLARQGQGLAALRLFDEAEQARIPLTEHAADRGLAYDLAGDNTRAQQQYRAALAARNDPDVARRLALSQAISGNHEGAEATLLPMLRSQDRAAYRTRAFALAISGKPDEAVSIATSLLPREISGRLAPYLRYMPRLTRAQQAAAANLGLFPRAAEIGRDNPALAAYTGGAGADARLVPSGAPLGRGGARNAAATPAQPVQVARAAPPAAAPAQPAQRPSQRTVGGAATQSQIVAERRALARAEREARAAAAAQARTAAAAPPAQPAAAAPTPTLAVAAPRVPAPVAAVPAAAPAAPPPAQPAVAAAPPAPAELPPVAPPPAAAVIAPPVAAEPAPPRPVVVAVLPPPPVSPPLAAAVVPSPAPAAAAEIPRPSLSISAPVPAPVPAAPVPAPAPQQISLSQAFADLTLEQPVVAPAPGAVDITLIVPPREQPPVAAPPPAPKPAAKPAPKPAPPAPPPVPSRHWVQVATGRDTAALAFDWRRIKRAGAEVLADAKPHVASWGETNRLVAGPFASVAAADKAVAALKEKQVESFRFTSAQGEAVRPLD